METSNSNGQNGNGHSTAVSTQVLADTPATESVFSLKGFEHGQRVAMMLSKSSLVPKEYQGNVQNTMIALEMATRIGASPLMVMQNLYIVHGKPSWSSTFIIAALNSCGRFSPLRFDINGDGDEYGCTAWTFGKDGEKLVGPKVTLKMVKAEGWMDKNGSKWKTMPELMFRYRSAAFFGRLYAPDILMGMHAMEEIIDLEPTVVSTEQNRDNKEAERVEILIREARSLKDLEVIQQHVNPEQMELFQTKMQELS